jgi:putative FmdB family regulatory protein
VPTYQYACTACDERLEAVQSFTDAPLTQCPACGGALRKVFSAVGVVFKGSGFYKTDSRAKTGSSETKSDTKAGSGDKAAATTSSSGSDSSSSSSSTASSTPAPAASASKSA